MVLSVVGDILSWQGTFGFRTMRPEEQLVLQHCNPPPQHTHDFIYAHNFLIYSIGIEQYIQSLCRALSLLSVILLLLTMPLHAATQLLVKGNSILGHADSLFCISHWLEQILRVQKICSWEPD